MTVSEKYSQALECEQKIVKQPGINGTIPLGKKSIGKKQIDKEIEWVIQLSWIDMSDLHRQSPPVFPIPLRPNESRLNFFYVG